MNSTLRPDLQLIADWIRPKSRVLDLGCGDGALLAYLQQHKNVSGYGVEIDVDNVVAGVAAGINVLQGDLEAGLSTFEADRFDTVVLSQTIQAMHHTEEILVDMLRVAGEAIVTFPNFGYWRNRVQILQGRMPVSERMPYQWYNTPNIHWCMLGDFDALCAKNNIRVRERRVMTGGKTINFMPNLLGSLAFYRVSR